MSLFDLSNPDNAHLWTPEDGGSPQDQLWMIEDAHHFELEALLRQYVTESDPETKRAIMKQAIRFSVRLQTFRVLDDRNKARKRQAGSTPQPSPTPENTAPRLLFDADYIQQNDGRTPWDVDNDDPGSAFKTLWITHDVHTGRADELRQQYINALEARYQAEARETMRLLTKCTYRILILSLAEEDNRQRKT